MTELAFPHKDKSGKIFHLLRRSRRRRKKPHVQAGLDAIEMRQTTPERDDLSSQVSRIPMRDFEHGEGLLSPETVGDHP